MEPNDQWQFPVDDFKISNGHLCTWRSEDVKDNEFFPDKFDTKFVSTGMRLECHPIKVPGGAYGYDEEIPKTPEVMIDATIPFNDLSDLVGKTIELGESVETCERELGSMYLFSVHNDVRWTEIRFGDLSGEQIGVELDLHFDVDYDEGETQFQHTLKGALQVEKRWES